MITNRTSFLFFILIALMMTSCRPDDDPAASCTDGGIFRLAATAQVIRNSIVDDEADDGLFWVCSGGELTLSGTGNIVLVDNGGKLTINGDENEAFNLDGGVMILNGDENEVWLNGDSKTTVYGTENLLYYYRIGQLIEYGKHTYVEDLCGNVEVDFSLAPEEGCQ